MRGMLAAAAVSAAPSAALGCPWQALPALKHTQYSFRHRAFLQLHLLYTVPWGAGTGSGMNMPSPATGSC